LGNLIGTEVLWVVPLQTEENTLSPIELQTTTLDIAGLHAAVAVPSQTVSSSQILPLTSINTYVDASATPIFLTLPSPSEAKGFSYLIKKIDFSANPVTVIGPIEGSSELVIENPLESYIIASNGTEFYISAKDTLADVFSVFGRTKNVVAETGDYDVSQVIGAAPLDSPTFTGTVTVPDNSTLGTPSELNLSNAIDLPLETGVTGNLDVSHLNSGSGASSTTFWRGDGTWSSPPGGISDTARRVSVSGVNTITLLSTDSRGGISIVQAPGSTTTVQLPNLDGPYPVFDASGSASSMPITVLPPSGQTINGLDSYILSFNYQSVSFYLDGSQVLAL